MKLVFDSGFTKNSYLNLTKTYTEEIYKRAINAPSNLNEKIKTKGFKFHYIDDNSLNACVDIIDNNDIMQINTGTLVTVYSFIHSAFSNPNIYSDIGYSKDESGLLTQGFFDIDKKQILFNHIPRDENRRNISEYVSLLATRFIVMHELGHLINGHVHYLGTLSGDYNVKMIDKYRLSKINKEIELSYALDRRTLEMDADAFAATNSMGNLLEIIKDKKYYSYIFDHLQEPYQIFELWSFAVHLIFMEFERNAESSYSKENYYLPNDARALLCYDSAVNTIKALRECGHFNCTDEQVASIEMNMFKGIINAKEYYNNLHGTKFSFGESILCPEFISFVEEVQNHWNNELRYGLEEFSRALLYNPNGMKL